MGILWFFLGIVVTILVIGFGGAMYSAGIQEGKARHAKEVQRNSDPPDNSSWEEVE